MPAILSSSLRRAEGRTVDVSVRIRWTDIERATPYWIRFTFYEQDSGFRGSDDFLEVSDHLIAETDRPTEGTFPFTITGRTSWNNERGNEEIYANISVFPDVRERALPGSSRSRTNVISGRFP